MANNDMRFGLRPVQNTGSGNYCDKVRLYYAPSTYATGLFIGDCVTITGNSNASQVVTGSGTYRPRTLSEVNKTAAGDGNAISGVIVGFDADPDNLSNVYGAASTERVIAVVDDPNAIFEIQADGSVTADDVGLNAVLIDTHAGSTATGYSGTELDTTSDVPAADASNQLTILGFVDREDNDESSANPKLLVRINNHTNAHGAVGIA